MLGQQNEVFVLGNKMADILNLEEIVNVVQFSSIGVV